LGSLQGAFLSIDHHPADNDPATYVIRDTRAVATAELLARLFGADPQLAACLDATTAQALYAGIYTDTGQLLFDSVTAPLFDLLAGLVRAGAVPGQVGRTLYSTHPWSRLCLMQRFLASLRRECHGTVCIGSLTPEDYQATGAAPQDCEGFVDMARSIQGVELGVLLDYGQSPSSKGSTVRASMRARSPQWRLDALAAHWGGGGHPAAAGFTSQATDLGGFYPVFLQQLQAHVARVTASGADDTFAPTPS
jgi:phosphoesterase RecJ-like protein